MTLRDIIGHRRLTLLIARAIERETLPPTLLFAGPSGVGKWAVARATAQAVNCLDPSTQSGLASQAETSLRTGPSTQSGLASQAETSLRTGPSTSLPAVPSGELPWDACGTCRACDRIARGVHVDVLMLEPDDRATIKIDVVREMLSKVSYRPFEGRRRVVLIREADTIQHEAQNSLLKSLEEPPPGTMFILTTAVPGVLLPTVRSRCMRLGFGRLTAAEVAAGLTRDHEYNDVEARQAAPLSDGSLGQALALIDHDLTMFRDLAIGLLRNSAGRSDIQSRMQAASPLHTVSPKKERTREDVATILRLMASMLRDLEAINAGADRAVLANPLLTTDLEALARAYSGDRARTAFSAVDRALMALERNAGMKVVTEWLAVQM